MSMPARGGQHVVKVFLRSANVANAKDPDNPLRPSTREVYGFRAADVAVLQQYTPSHPVESEDLSSLGNLETVPPYSHGGQSYPFGRMIMGGKPGFLPDASFTRMLESQAIQPLLWVDTSWLLVGHVDETIGFVKVDSPRGWALVLSDPELAVQMLEEAAKAGHGATAMFEGQLWAFDVDASTTIDGVLADTEVMAETAKAAVEIKAQLAVLKKETGITEEEIIRVPTLHYLAHGRSAAYQPAAVNGVVLADGHYVTPAPHGPLIDGVDIFKAQLEEAFAPHGIKVHYAEEWSFYHRYLGEVHCGTNAQRAVPADVKWWESGR